MELFEPLWAGVNVQPVDYFTCKNNSMIGHTNLFLESF